MVDSNPAVPSVTLQCLLPPAAVVVELRGGADPSLLLPAEAQFLGRSVPSRAREFTAGRLCARRALAELGIVNFAIEKAEDRRPLWPSDVVGSITHTNDFCAAVVARRCDYLSIGLDSEGAARVTPKLWKSICLAEEVAWLESLPPESRAAAASLIFSAKEAFYKCQYPLTGQYLGFHAVRVELRNWGAPRGRLELFATRPIEFARHAPGALTGEYLFHDELVTTAFHLPAVGNSLEPAQ